MDNLAITLIISASIPSAITGFMFWFLQKKIEQKSKERELIEQKRHLNEMLIIKTIGASLALSEATAAAVQRIPDAHCNGDMHDALDYARKVKHDHKDFLFGEAVSKLI